jgi:pantoate--beta-alanine ligase
MHPAADPAAQQRLMRVVQTASEMRVLSDEWRHAGKSVAFVPTMGYLHEGHLSLLRDARAVGDICVLSIFVNPTQFGPKEDLGRYPRDLDGDLAKARTVGVDVAFVPTAEEMYPRGYQTFVDVRELSQGLCGASRPGHFTGVATVVTKLFGLVHPTVAFFGKKDYQQWKVLERMAADLNLGVRVVGRPIMREPDGLAMSSRNSYLSPAERASAVALRRGLVAARAAWDSGERRAAALVAAARASVDAEPAFTIDYLELRDAESLALVDGEVARLPLLAVAAFIGARRTRLIDNTVLGESEVASPV